MINNNFKLIINKDNLLHNITYLTTIKNKKIIPVIKANAYGHGISEIVSILYSSGQKEFLVAKLSEALKILKNGTYPDIKIIVLESIRDFALVKDIKNIFLSINNMTHLQDALNNGIPSDRMHLKIDFGFGRNGIFYDQQKELLDIIKDKNLTSSGIYTHLFASTYNDGLEVINNFTKLVNKIGKEKFKIIHLQNSASVFNYDCEIATHIRPGMLTYGLQESGYYEPNLKQVFSLIGAVEEIKSVKENKYLAYELKDSLGIDNHKNIARITIGYGDGFIKKNEFGKCLIKNKEFEIKQITMDNTFVLVDDNIKVGDEVSLYHDVSKTVNHLEMGMQEVLALINDRIERVIK